MQRYVKAEFGKELNLELDCKTRWNRPLNMLTRIIQVNSCIRKVMIDVKNKVQLTEAEIDTIKEIVLALEPVNQAVEAQCCQETNLISADCNLRCFSLKNNTLS